MDFDFSDTQKQLGETASRFFAEAASSAKMRASLRDTPDGHDRDLWRGLAELGILGVAIPEADGGLGLSDLDLCVVAETAGRALARAPLASTLYWSAEALVRLGTTEQRQRWLPAIAAGEAIAACVDLDLCPGASIASGSAGLTGVLPVVADGLSADLLVILSEAGSWLVELAAPGVSRTAIQTIDPLQPFARLTLTNVVAEALSSEDPARDLAAMRNRAAVLIAFEQIGGADAALDAAVAYAKDRMAFGRQIGSFQAVKHLLANMYVSASLARSNAYYAGWALAEQDRTLSAAAAAARLSATEAYRRCSADGLQVHGGIGFTWELDCHFHYRRANQLALSMGDAKHWEDQLLDALVADRAVAGDA